MTNQPSESQNQSLPARTPGSFQWVAALVLIALGIIFLLQETGSIALGDKWWVIFLLLPAAGLFYDAWQRYRADACGRADPGRRDPGRGRADFSAQLELGADLAGLPDPRWALHVGAASSLVG